MEPILDVEAVFTALEKWINQRPGLDPREYGYGRDGAKAYRNECRAIAKDRKRALSALADARGLAPARSEVLVEAFKRAYSGRLRLIVNKHDFGDYKTTSPCKYCGVAYHAAGLYCQQNSGVEFDYCTGQYWPTEYRKAAASVLETYVVDWRQREQAVNPQVFRYATVEDVIAANRAVGGHFFDRAAMKFFGSRIESGLIVVYPPAPKFSSDDWTCPCGLQMHPSKRHTGQVHIKDCPFKPQYRFVTSEKNEDRPRRYSVRCANPDGTIGEVSEFQQYGTRAQAETAARQETV